MVIYWTRLAQESLRQVLEYYLPITGYEKAISIVNDIICEARPLANMPNLGSRFTINHKQYHKLTSKRYTLFYEVNDEGIFIDLVWDNRRDPDALRNLL